jgi:hypothetical protein
MGSQPWRADKVTQRRKGDGTAGPRASAAILRARRFEATAAAGCATMRAAPQVVQT